ncbi:probable phosphoglycerate mutase [Sphingomonas gellani]|uniref:Probable phosphoglycerate mutase n=1 Tax=Sphingomonas gellani TaxID=1166340 RepID=A0A1H8I892_9SPHN|nr:histidine phosphatase family protein [Sphingomonas gellani]SEN64482.1 probable phosphoglycerate mutase [Sphingomonas gellani]
MNRTLVIVRHGNTFSPGEPPRRIGLRTDPPLAPSGQVQARALGRWFAEHGWRFDRILSSPLRRTRETAETIGAAQATAPPIEPSDLLAEIDHGVDENRLESEVVDRIGVQVLADWDRHGKAPEGWKVERAARLGGWRELFAQGRDDTLLLVTSNGAARFALLADAVLTAQAGALPSLKLRTGAFGMVEITEAGVRLAAWDVRPDR